MSDRGAPPFPAVDEYRSIRMGVDIANLTGGNAHVVESQCRLQREEGYGFICALWWLWLPDGRSAVSVPPGAGPAVRSIAEHVQRPEQLAEPELAEALKPPVDAALRRAGLGPIYRHGCGVSFACNATLLRRHSHGDCRRLIDESIPPAEGISLPTHCFPEGTVYAVVADGCAVSIAFAHRTTVMEDRVADLGVETAERYRRHGYAQTTVSAVAEHMARRGGEAVYDCSPTNHASIATARSVGFVPYGIRLVLSAPAPDLRPRDASTG